MFPTNKQMWFYISPMGKYDLSISRKSIHKRKYFTANTIINNLVNKWGRKIILRKSTIDVLVINTLMHCSLFLHDKNNIGNPISKRNSVNKTNMQKFFNLCFNGTNILWMNRMQTLSHWFDIRIHFDFMFNYIRVNTWHLLI